MADRVRTLWHRGGSRNSTAKAKGKMTLWANDVVTMAAVVALLAAAARCGSSTTPTTPTTSGGSEACCMLLCCVLPGGVSCCLLLPFLYAVWLRQLQLAGGKSREKSSSPVIPSACSKFRFRINTFDFILAFANVIPDDKITWGFKHLAITLIGCYLESRVAWTNDQSRVFVKGRFCDGNVPRIGTLKYSLEAFSLATVIPQSMEGVRGSTTTPSRVMTSGRGRKGWEGATLGDAVLTGRSRFPSLSHTTSGSIQATNCPLSGFHCTVISRPEKQLRHWRGNLFSLWPSPAGRTRSILARTCFRLRPPLAKLRRFQVLQPLIPFFCPAPGQ